MYSAPDHALIQAPVHVFECHLLAFCLLAIHRYADIFLKVYVPLCQVPVPEYSLREYNSLMPVSCLGEMQTKRQQLCMRSKAFLLSTFH